MHEQVVEAMQNSPRFGWPVTTEKRMAAYPNDSARRGLTLSQGAPAGFSVENVTEHRVRLRVRPTRFGMVENVPLSALRLHN